MNPPRTTELITRLRKLKTSQKITAQSFLEEMNADYLPVEHRISVKTAQNLLYGSGPASLRGSISSETALAVVKYCGDREGKPGGSSRTSGGKSQSAI